MSYSPSPQPKQNSGCSTLIILLVIIAIGYSAVRYFVDRNNYNMGHRAYQEANCALAISHFSSVLDAWRLVDIGGFPALARQERTECLSFQAAVDKQQTGDFGSALVAYMNFVRGYSNSPLAEVARANGTSMFEQAKPSALANQEACENIDALLQENLIPQQDVNLPPLYLSCAEVYNTAGNQQGSFDMYQAFLTEYPNHALAAEAETSLIANPLACEQSDSLKNSVIAERFDFMPSLYFQCGQAYENQGYWDQAITMFENFLADYPYHARASEAEAGLARSIVAQARAASAGEIPAPGRSGSTGSAATEVIIQNDSPERLRIVFSGPEARVEELKACDSCTTYSVIGPLYCPEKGPIGRYRLSPGDYDVVVEASSDTGTTPWTGNWSLVSGDEYYSCFFVVTTFNP